MVCSQSKKNDRKQPFGSRFPSGRVKESSEKVILAIAIISFLIHLAIIFLVDFSIISLEEVPQLLKSPIAAI